MPPWPFDFAPHLGFPGVDTPYFAASAPIDPCSQIERIAEEGFRSVCDNMLMARPAAERRELAGKLRACGLRMSSCVDHPHLGPAPWTSTRGKGLSELRDRVDRALDIASAVGVDAITIVALDDGRSTQDQISCWAENLSWAGPLAKAAGTTLVLEPVNPDRLPGVFVTEVDRAASILNAAAAPGCAMSFDAAHIYHGNGDLIAAWRRVSDLVGLVQIASENRCEPGSGKLDIASFLREVAGSAYGGAVELEHRHSGTGIESERTSLSRLRQLSVSAASPFKAI